MFQSFTFYYIYIFSAHIVHLSEITGQMAIAKKITSERRCWAHFASAKLSQECKPTHTGRTAREKRDRSKPCHGAGPLNATLLF